MEKIKKMRGRIVFYIPQRKFGFIHTSDGQEFFFHVSNFIKGTPALSQNVEFEIAPAIREGKSDQAVCIIPIDLVDVSTRIYDALSGGAN